jgi:[FeFe] hydrogenase H-cluster maturation GTPase HydF
MGLNQTPSSERVHIGFFGRQNAGKSSIVNAVTGQDLAVISEIEGTTTDPVKKAMELLPLGPVVVIDTPGIDDTGRLGGLRVKKTRQMLNKTDVAVLVVDALKGMTEAEHELIEIFNEKHISYLVVHNKADLLDEKKELPKNEVYASAKTGYHIKLIKDTIAAMGASETTNRRIVGDLISPSDFVVLVVPIDKGAPKGRLILPQQQTIRDILETGASAVVVRENELKGVLKSLVVSPKLVITDSQVFAKVNADTPKDIMLTSFSILFARYKGDLQMLVHGAAAIDELQDGDTILISEGCTHHRQCEDIGSVKLPRWLKTYNNKNIKIELSSGGEFPADLRRFRLVVHCGGCVLNDREMKYRIKSAIDQNVPITNYGIAIAHMQGILERSLELFPRILSELER